MPLNKYFYAYYRELGCEHRYVGGSDKMLCQWSIWFQRCRGARLDLVRSIHQYVFSINKWPFSWVFFFDILWIVSIFTNDYWSNEKDIKVAVDWAVFLLFLREATNIHHQPLTSIVRLACRNARFYNITCSIKIKI